MTHKCGICGHYNCIASDFEDAHTRVGIRPPPPHPLFKKNRMVNGQTGEVVYDNMFWNDTLSHFDWGDGRGFIEVGEVEAMGLFIAPSP